MIDNAPSHPEILVLNAIDRQCEVMFLPPNITALIQPMNQGCIAAKKKRYKTSLLRELIAYNFPDMSSVNEFLSKWSLLDCCNLVAYSWKQLSEATLGNCWTKILTPYNKNNTNAQIHQLNLGSDNESATEIVALANKMPGGENFSLTEIEE